MGRRRLEQVPPHPGPGGGEIASSLHLSTHDIFGDSAARAKSLPALRWLMVLLCVPQLITNGEFPCNLFFFFCKRAFSLAAGGVFGNQAEEGRPD